MIVVDSSALMSLLLREATARNCAERLFGADEVVMSAATLAEALIVAQRRRLAEDMRQLLDIVRSTIAPVDARAAEHAADVYRRYGKGAHSAKLNYGDCFAYALAEANGAPLLYVGEDFRRTDIISALAS